MARTWICGRSLPRRDQPPRLREVAKGELENTPLLVPFADLKYLARNRTLHPQLGRWQQRDPNGTGQPVLSILSYHGASMFATVGDFGLSTHFGDSLSTHEYVGGDPINNSDPSGLFFSVADLMGGTSWQADLQGDHTDGVLETGGGLRDFIYSRFSDYGNNQ